MERESLHIKQSKTADSGAIAFAPFESVKILDPYIARGMEKEVRYLLRLNADKLLYWFYRNAKLGPKGAASGYGGWESSLIGGHFTGHYLSALAQGYANANTSSKDKAALLARIRYFVSAFVLCQNHAEEAGAKRGFLWGANTLENGNPEFQFDNVEKGRTDIGSESWVPWYTMHKLLAGLSDVYRLIGDNEALDVARKLGDWVCNRVNGWNEETRKTVLATEYGGMNDCLYDLFALTGEEKFAAAAHAFDEESLLETILKDEDDYLDGLHANTTVPKVIGFLNRYTVLNGKTADAEKYLCAAELFWERVVNRHAYITGGVSEWERFGKDNVLNARRTNCNCETCVAYNMLKLTRSLFRFTLEKKYLDYYERTYLNSVLSSQNPETGMTTYFQPMASGYFKVYSSPERNFWCCTGTGTENFTKCGDSVYFDAGNATYVSLYIASEYHTKTVSLSMAADLESSDEVRMKVNRGRTVLRLRRPDWSDGFQVAVNGKEVEILPSDEFVSADVKAGDEVIIRMRKRLKAHSLADGENVYAFTFGPFVLSADLGTENMQTGETGVGVTVPQEARNAKEEYGIVSDGAFGEDPVLSHMKRAGKNKFLLDCAGETLTYSCHFRRYRERYGIYMKFRKK